MVASRTREEGRHEFYKDVLLNWRDSYHGGSEVYSGTYTKRMYDHYCERFKGGKHQPRALVPGGRPFWRDPDGYYILIHDWTLHSVGETHDRWNDNDKMQEFLSEFYVGVNAWTESRYSMSGGGPRFPEDLESEAIVKALDKIKGEVAGIGEDLAEAVKSYNMITSSVYTLGNALWQVKRGNIPGALAAIRDPRGIVRQGANLYLQYQYGWKPLVMDVWNSCNALWGPKRYAFTPLMHYRKGLPHRTTTLIPSVNEHMECQGTVNITGSLNLWWLLDTPALGFNMDKIGLSNPLSLGWNLIPYSFVIDWMLPIGGILDSMTPPQGTKFVGGTVTARYSGAGNFTAKQRDRITKPDSSSFETFCMNRKTYGSWPRAGLYVKSPFSLPHGLTSVALFLQNLLR